MCGLLCARYRKNGRSLLLLDELDRLRGQVVLALAALRVATASCSPCRRGTRRTPGRSAGSPCRRGATCRSSRSRSPTSFRYSASVFSSSGSCWLIFGCSSFCDGASGRPGRNVVRCSRAGDLPVISAAAGRRADRAGRVRGREPRALLGERVEVRRVVVLAAVAAQVVDAEVVGEDEDDVRPVGRRDGGRGEQDQKYAEAVHDSGSRLWGRESPAILSVMGRVGKDQLVTRWGASARLPRFFVAFPAASHQ